MDIADASADSVRRDERLFRASLRRLWLVPASVVLAGLSSVGLVSACASDWTVWAAAGAGAGFVAAEAVAVRQARWLVSRRRAEKLIDRARTGMRLARLEEVAADACKDVVAIREAVGRGEQLDQNLPGAVPSCPPGPFGDVEHALRRLAAEAVDAAAQGGDQRQVDVLVHIARRLARLVSRTLRELSDQEREVEDPVRLDGLWRLDNLATRIRRQVESLGVLGGAVPRRVSDPVPLASLLRQAIAEVEQYPRVRVPVLPEGAVLGFVAAELTHLLAELVENATVFSRPDTQVLVGAELVPAGLAVEIEDRGLTIPPADLRRANQLLVSPERYDVRQQIAAGRIGLYVVARIAARHGIHVELATNKYGGTRATVIVPDRLLSTAPDEIPVSGPRVEAYGAEPAIAHDARSQVRGFPPRVPAGDSTGADALRSVQDGRVRSGPSRPRARESAPAQADGKPSLPQRGTAAHGPVSVPEEHARPVEGDGGPADPGLADPGLMARFSAGARRGTRLPRGTGPTTP